MRITGPTRTTGAQAGGGARRADGGGSTFSLDAGNGPQRAPASTGGSAAASLSSLDALIALQSIDADRPRGKRRAVRQGNDLLDVLEELKVGLLSGQVSGAALDRIAHLVSTIEPSGEPALDSLLADIALRAEVELAKLGRYVARG